MGSNNPFSSSSEPPIFINQLWYEENHDFDHSNITATERRPSYPNEVWIDISSIPATPPTQTVWPGTPSGIVTGVSGVVLIKQVPVPTGANPERYEAAPAPTNPAGATLENAIPPNYGGGVYKPILSDANGAIIEYDPRVWVLDSVQAVVEFRNGIPAGYVAPLIIDFWYYTGAIAGAGGGGEVNTGANVGGGDGVFRDKTGTVLNFKSLLAAGPIALTPAADTITIDSAAEANTASNVGAGSQVFKQKTGADLEFRTLTAGTNVTLTQNADDIVIDATDTGEANTGANVGGGDGVFRDKTGVTLNFKSLLATGSITLTPAADTITIDSAAEANTASNVGAGSQVFKQKTGVDLEFRTLTAGTNVTLTQNANDIVIDASGAGEVNTASNVGAGSQVFKQKTGVDLEFRTLTAGTNVTLTQNANDVEVAATGDGAGLLGRPYIFLDTKPAGTHGGTTVSGAWNLRTLNTVDPNGNPNLDAVLVANQVTLQPGDYYVKATAPAIAIEEHKIRLRDVTNGVTLLVGTSEHTRSPTQLANATQSRSIIEGIISVGGVIVTELQHYTVNNGPNPPASKVTALGVATGAGSGEVEVYSIISFTKI